jgi:hypothetical protein
VLTKSGRRKCRARCSRCLAGCMAPPQKKQFSPVPLRQVHQAGDLCDWPGQVLASWPGPAGTGNRGTAKPGRPWLTRQHTVCYLCTGQGCRAWAQPAHRQVMHSSSEPGAGQARSSSWPLGWLASITGSMQCATHIALRVCAFHNVPGPCLCSIANRQRFQARLRCIGSSNFG